tara:strand:- start:553 stop:687 length:135 start_codon:yes stop_codon:yes gene_type:complete
MYFGIITAIAVLAFLDIGLEYWAKNEIRIVDIAILILALVALFV